MQETTHAQLSKQHQELIAHAQEAMDTAYAPYSQFKVGAAIRDSDGEITTGSNVENAAYGNTICAERAAILRANAKGLRNTKTIAVATHGETISAPCGSCRQVLYEAAQAAGNDIQVLMYATGDERVVIAGIQELLPLAFGPHDVQD